jgi:hypothetical protein
MQPDLTTAQEHHLQAPMDDRLATSGYGVTMTEQPSSVSLGRRSLINGLIAHVLGACLLLFGATSAEAAMITWEWAGPVTGYQCAFGPCPIDLDTVVPLGTPVTVSMAFDPVAPPPNPSLPCLKGTATVSLEVVGQTYTNGGFVWDEAHGFGPGVCVPGYNFVEVVVPGWVGGPALPGGWIPFSGLDGFWWGGDLTTVQPTAIASQFPAFYRIGQSSPQRFTASLRAVTDPSLPVVPEPSTWLLMSSGLSAAAWWRRRR